MNYVLSLLKRRLAILICAGAAKAGNVGTLPGLPGTWKATISINAYIVGCMTRPAHPWMELWGHESYLSMSIMCRHSARRRVKSGCGAKEGGFFKKPSTLVNVIRVSMIIETCLLK